MIADAAFRALHAPDRVVGADGRRGAFRRHDGFGALVRWDGESTAVYVDRWQIAGIAAKVGAHA